MRRRRSGLNFGRQKKKVNMSVVKEVCVWIIEIAITLLVAFTLVYFVGLRTSVVGQSMAEDVYKRQMLDKDGRLPRIKEALLADAVATTAGAVLGTSTTTTFVESSSGVAAGARTGLSSVVTGFLFLISVVLSPIFCSIPSFATAPALI